ncbi:unnamed protein product [Rotaria socialis]
MLMIWFLLFHDMKEFHLAFVGYRNAVDYSPSHLIPQQDNTNTTDCDLGTCCFAHWCCPCFVCKLQARTNECLCTGCLPGANTALRTKIRTGFRIRGAVCGDACAMCCCPCCSIIQMYNELEFQGL